MVSQRLIKLYYEKLKKPTIIYGLVLHPFMIDDKIRWEYENPNDVSFATNVVEGHLEEMLHDFLSLAGLATITHANNGLDWSQLSKDYCRLSKEDVHVSKNTRNKINKALENLDKIRLEDGSVILNSECVVKNWSLEYPDTEALYFHLDLELFNPIIEGVNADDDELQDFIQSFVYDDDANEQEQDIISDVMRVIYDEPNLLDHDYMFIAPVIGYFDTFGNGLT
jgi:hypothetical protein